MQFLGKVLNPLFAKPYDAYETVTYVHDQKLFNDLDFQKFIAAKKLNAGSMAQIYLVEVSGGLKVAVRIVEGEKSYEMHLRAAKYKMAPQLYSTTYISGTERGSFTVSVMQLIDSTLTEYMKKIRNKPDKWYRLCGALHCILEKKYLLNFLHGDFHTDNLVILHDGRTLGCIDFDFAIMSTKPSELDYFILMDFIPLVSSFLMEKDNVGRAMADCVRDFLKKTFNMNIDLARLKSFPQGGYYYETKKGKKLNSYIAEKRFQYSVNDIIREFPAIRFPEIVRYPRK